MRGRPSGRACSLRLPVQVQRRAGGRRQAGAGRYQRQARGTEGPGVTSSLRTLHCRKYTTAAGRGASEPAACWPRCCAPVVFGRLCSRARWAHRSPRSRNKLPGPPTPPQAQSEVGTAFLAPQDHVCRCWHQESSNNDQQGQGVAGVEHKRRLPLQLLKGACVASACLRPALWRLLSGGCLWQLACPMHMPAGCDLHGIAHRRKTSQGLHRNQGRPEVPNGVLQL